MSQSTSKIQGEGDYKSAKSFNKKTRQFVKEGKVEQNKNTHKDLSQSEKEQAAKAEEKARAHARN